MRPRGRGPARLDHGRRPPVHDAAVAAVHQHHGRRRPGAAGRRRGPAAEAGAGAAGARPPGAPDGAPPRRARLHARLLGRRPRRRRGRRPRGRSRPAGLLPHLPRGDQRGLLRRPEGGALPRHQQHRQRRPRLPRALDRGPEAVRGRDRDHDLVRRPDGGRPGRAVGRERRQRAAGDDEVPLPRPEGGHPGRGGEPAPRARPGPVLGAVERRERPARHAHDRRLLPGQHRGRRGLRDRGPEAPDRGGRR